MLRTYKAEHIVVVVLATVCLLFVQQGSAQNLPSLLTGRDVNSTFSITAYDEKAQEWGIAVATNNICVGNSTIYIQPGVGAISVIAETDPKYGIEGLAHLKEGKTPDEAFQLVAAGDSLGDYRQVAIIDKKGDVYGHTGHALTYWKGQAACKAGYHCIVTGNQLAAHVLDSMLRVFENTNGTLAQRLMAGLLAGQKAGGQITGKQSAAIIVKGTAHEWFEQTDLRVDNAKDPFAELQTLLHYYDGRKMLNQALGMIRSGNTQQAAGLLQHAEKLTEGWTGLYGKLVAGYVMLGREQKAVSLIRKALKTERKWKENLPSFYYLRGYSGYKSLIDIRSFDETDWCNAIQQDLNMNKVQDAFKLMAMVAPRFPASSFLRYLNGKIFLAGKNVPAARECFLKALELDPENGDAHRELQLLL